MPNDLLAELAQIDHVDYVKQANNDNLAPVDGLGLYAGNDEVLAARARHGRRGRHLRRQPHRRATQMRRMVDEPDRRAAIHAELGEVFAALFVTTSPAPVKAALDMLGHPVGGLRLPLVEADEAEAAVVRGALEHHGLLQTAGA